MDIPEDPRRLIVGRIGEAVVERRSRPVREPRITVEAGERLGPRRPHQSREMKERCSERRGKDENAADPAPARHLEPQPEPGHGDEKAADDQHRNDGRPQPFPGEDQFGAAGELVQARLHAGLARCRLRCPTIAHADLLALA